MEKLIKFSLFIASLWVANIAFATNAIPMTSGRGLVQVELVCKHNGQHVIAMMHYDEAKAFSGVKDLKIVPISGKSAANSKNLGALRLIHPKTGKQAVAMTSKKGVAVFKSAKGIKAWDEDAWNTSADDLTDGTFILY